MSETSRYPELIVGALLVNPQGQLFVARFSKIAGHYAIPGGHVEYGETAAQALARELEEETGLTPTSFHLLQVTERIRPPLYKDGRLATWSTWILWWAAGKARSNWMATSFRRATGYYPERHYPCR